MSGPRDQDVTVAVAQAESQVLAAVRALYDGVTPRQLASVTWVGPRAAIERLEALVEAANALAAADEAEAAEIAAADRRSGDWYAEYAADMAERACRGRSS
ncbi:MAG: hypothetical protein DYG90_05650 [Chloroflexi bacterium CFX6]|nr:hypothetical protein [Chloroflexi bacterium CFX6]